MKRLDVVLAVAVACFAAALVAQEGGRALSEDDPLRYFAEPTTDVGVHGYEWVAASAALSDRGLAPGLSKNMREGLEWQLQKGNPASGLGEGEVPATDEGCAPRHPLSPGFYVQEEQDGRFSTALLLSEVAVVATLKAATPGFFDGGNPGVLFSLSDVAPLHAGSAPVDYVLVPFDRLVIRGHVFCAVTPSESRWEGSPHPQIGNRVVVMGERGFRGVVRTGAWWRRLGHMASVDENQVLHWNGGMWSGHPGRPESLSALRSRVAEAVSGGLFDVTERLVPQEYGSPERVEFAAAIRRYEADGCRVASVFHGGGGEWSPKRLVCPAAGEKLRK